MSTVERLTIQGKINNTQISFPYKVRITKKYLFQNVFWDASMKRWYCDFGSYPAYLGNEPVSTSECRLKDKIISFHFNEIYDGTERKWELERDLTGNFDVSGFSNENDDIIFSKI